MKMKLFNNKKILYGAIGVVVVITIAISVYFYFQYQSLQSKLQNPNTALGEVNRQLLEKVGKLIELPTGEDPTIATINDIEKLKNQPFFARAKNGDKLIVYNNARKAYLYDPTTEKLVDVAPVNINNSTASASTSPSPSENPQPMKIAILNGTDTNGITKKVEQDIKSKTENTEIIIRDNAKKKDYEKTIVVDLTGESGVAANSMAKLVNGSVAPLPSGEIKPVTATGQSPDMIIIVGKDYPSK